MDSMITILSFLFFTALVGVLTWLITRKDDHVSSDGYFLGGRTLTFPIIAGSLLLTNLSTEQLVGLNGAAYTDGLCVMVWEVVSVVALVFMAWFFLPRFLKSGVATVPQYLEIRFDHHTSVITNVIFLLAYVGILLPIILYTGATGMMGILDVTSMLGSLPDTLGMDAHTLSLWLIVWIVGIIGSIYALFGGLRSVAVSDTLNGVGLLVGGFLITGYALSLLGGDGGIPAGASRLFEQQRARFNSVGNASTSVPFGMIFSGIFLLNLFYWTTNQQIIQRTFGASSLAEGQKGVLLTGVLKLICCCSDRNGFEACSSNRRETGTRRGLCRDCFRLLCAAVQHDRNIAARVSFSGPGVCMVNGSHAGDRRNFSAGERVRTGRCGCRGYDTMAICETRWSGTHRSGIHDLRHVCRLLRACALTLEGAREGHQLLSESQSRSDCAT